MLASLIAVFAAACGGGGGGSGGGSPNPDSQGPGLLAASAPSSHYVTVTFDGAVGGDALQAGSYEISGPTSALPVHAVSREAGGAEVTLTTGEQESVEYHLIYRGSDAGQQAASFTGSVEREPFLATALPLDETTVLLSFSAPVDATAEEEAFYQIVPAGGAGEDRLAVHDATRSTGDDTEVVLITDAQGQLEYVVEVPPTMSGAAQRLDPTRNTASFLGFNTVDTTAPRVTGAQAASNTEVFVYFNEPIRRNSVRPFRFVISGPNLGVFDAVANDRRTRVTLTTFPQSAAHKYTVTVTDIVDLIGNFIDLDHNTATFIGAPVDDSLPRVVGAASAGNTSVIVQFSKPMSESALVPSNYVIVQQNVNSEAGALAVTGAEFHETTLLGRTTVVLTTRSQNELTYELTAVNVTDLAGSPLAPPITDNGVLVDPTRATFPGTPPTCAPLSCANGALGLDGEGLCGSDDDCDDDPPCDVDEEDCFLQCEDPCQLRDADDDGVSDNEEQRGWTVTVDLGGGDTETREVTSDPDLPDTDGDGLDDATERRIGSDPRSADTDGDGLTDQEEFDVVFSDTNSRDSDGDGISDQAEVEFFKTNAGLADTDGDGLTDPEELFELNRDPRIADLPMHAISVGGMRLQLDERFTFTDETGETRTESSSTDVSTSNSSASTTMTFNTNVFRPFISFDVGIDSCTGEFVCTFLDRFMAISHFGAEFELTRGWNRDDTTALERAFQESQEKGRELTTSSAVTREVVGAGIDVDLVVENPGDIAFTLSNVEVTVQTTDPQDATRFVPVATLLPNSTLLTGEPAQFNVEPGGERGPILFSNREVFPNLVEDIMRAPSALTFRVSNFDVTTEDGRNFAFGFQSVLDRTAGILIDFGDGNTRRFQVTTAGVLNRPREQGGEIVGGFAGFAGTGTPRGIPLDFVLQDILHMRKSRPAVIVAGANGIVESHAVGDDLQLPVVELDGHPPHFAIVAPGRNGVLDTEPSGDDVAAAGIAAGPDGIVQTTALGDDVQLVAVGSAGLAADDLVVVPGPDGLLSTSPEGDDEFQAAPPDGILVGPDRVVNSVAQGDDIQLVPPGTTGVPLDTVAVAAGENGELDTEPRDDDTADVVTGYETSRTCNGDTERRIEAGLNGEAETVADSDDVQVETPATGGLAINAVVVAAGADGFLQTIPLGDDVLVGPGTPCLLDFECPSGACNGPENIVRIENRRRGQFRRQWSILLPDNTQLQTDFGLLKVRPGQTIALAFVQDIDRDGLIAPEEFLHGSSDFNPDTDGDGLGDFTEVRIGWDVGVVGQPIRRVFPDPARPDSDGDGLTDAEEQNLELVTSPNNLPQGSSTDPRLRDTDLDSVDDHAEVFGYLTGAGIVDPVNVIIAGSNRRADTIACPDSFCPLPEDGCVTDFDCVTGPCLPSGQCHCSNDGDCLGRICARLPAGCDDVQVVPVGIGGLDPRAVVIAPGPDGVLFTERSGDDFPPHPPLPAPPFPFLGLTGDGIAQSSAVGDDVPVVDVGSPVEDGGVCRDRSQFPMCAVVKPGPNGSIDSVPGSDDVFAAGQILETTDPLNADTDFDEIQDGIERDLGSSPNDPEDTGVFADRDSDGLTDNQESLLGWPVTVFTMPGHCSATMSQPCYVSTSCPSGETCQGVASSTRQVFSNRNVADTDGDGLPDFAERHLPCYERPVCQANMCSNNANPCSVDGDCLNECPTDPTSVDTDGDGIEDFDELSDDQFTEMERFNDFFPNFAIDGSTSEQFGTDPTRVDTDGDTLGDRFELLVGWGVRLPGGDARRVFSDPTLVDTDFDGLSDGAESQSLPRAPGASSTGPTDPNDPDTDGDTRLDGVECSETECTTDPLVNDRALTVTVTFATIQFRESPAPPDDFYAWRFHIQKPGETFPGSIVSSSLIPDAPIDAIFTAFDCFTAGHSGDAVVIGRFLCSGEPSTQIDLAHRNRCANDPSVTCGGSCGSLCNGDDLGCDICAPDPGDCDCIDSKAASETTFELKPGEGFVVNGFVNQGAYTSFPSDCVSGSTPGFCSRDSDCGVNGDCTFTLTSAANCHLPFVKDYRFESLQQGFTVEQFDMSDGDCRVNLIAEITVR